MLDSPFLKDNFDFDSFGFEHLIIIVFYTVFGVALIYLTKKYANRKQQIVIGNVFATLLLLTVLIWTFIKLWIGDFDVKKDLPLQLCYFTSIMAPLLSFTRKNIYYEILFFWVMSGTVQAMITPELQHSFPHYHFIKYWFGHAGVIIFMLYATFVYGMRPTIRSVFKSFVALQVFAVMAYLINILIGSNYFYVNGKPPVATMLDLLGDWPTYIFIAELIVIPYFLLIYLPFYLTRKKEVKITT